MSFERLFDKRVRAEAMRATAKRLADRYVCKCGAVCKGAASRDKCIAPTLDKSTGRMRYILPTDGTPYHKRRTQAQRDNEARNRAALSLVYAQEHEDEVQDLMARLED